MSWLRVFGWFLPCLLLGTCSVWGRQPNIVLLIADDLGYGEVGCYGHGEIPTPHIDSLAAGGVRFAQAYVTAPNCSPSRAGLLTGIIPTRFGYEFNPIGAKNEEPGVGLPLDQRTVANLLHDAGYTTGLIGKWHLGGTAGFHPQRRGFDEFFGFLHEGHFYVPLPWRGVTTMLRRRTLPGGRAGRWVSDRLIYSTHMGHDEPPYDVNNPVLRGSQPVTEPEYLTDAFTREGLDFIDRHQDKSFFLVVSYNAVHSPLQATDADLRRFTSIEDIHRRIFAAMLASLDDSVGRILDKLRQVGVERDTMVIFLSDNGGPTRELTSRNTPLRGEKGDMYEGGLRVPFLVQWPATLPSGKVVESAISSLDLLPTLATAVGAEPPAGIDGVNLLPYLTGEQSGAAHPWLYWRQGARTAFRQGDWKLVRNARNARQDAGWELFDLAHDVSEEHNQASDKREKVAELQTAWEQLDAQMIAPRFR